jgi:hypothetical protein
MEFTGLSFDLIKEWGGRNSHPDDLAKNVERWQESIDTGRAFQFEHRFPPPRRRYRWHLSRAHAVRDANGASSCGSAPTLTLMTKSN